MAGRNAVHFLAVAGGGCGGPLEAAVTVQLGDLGAQRAALGFCQAGRAPHQRHRVAQPLLLGRQRLHGRSTGGRDLGECMLLVNMHLMSCKKLTVPAQSPLTSAKCLTLLLKL